VQTVQGTVNQPAEEASLAVRRFAAHLGYALFEGHSEPDLLVFKKGVTPFSFGSTLTVKVDASLLSGTNLTVAPMEWWALPDGGRGKRAAMRLLEGVGASDVTLG
jgi:hypothetical protein